MNTLFLIFIGIMLAKNFQPLKESKWLEFNLNQPFISKRGSIFVIVRKPWWNLGMTTEYYDVSDGKWFTKIYSNARFNSLHEAKETLNILVSESKPYKEEE